MNTTTYKSIIKYLCLSLQQLQLFKNVRVQEDDVHVFFLLSTAVSLTQSM